MKRMYLLLLGMLILSTGMFAQSADLEAKTEKLGAQVNYIKKNNAAISKDLNQIRASNAAVTNGIMELKTANETTAKAVATCMAECDKNKESIAKHGEKNNKHWVLGSIVMIGLFLLLLLLQGNAKSTLNKKVVELETKLDQANNQVESLGKEVRGLSTAIDKANKAIADLSKEK